jgi:hypothetical protein
LNAAEKATQMGARYAVVSDPVASVVNVDFVDDYDIPGGDPVPADIFGSATCTNTACTVTGAANGESGFNSAAFNGIVDWMRRFDPRASPANVVVTYRNVGLGFSGNPTGPDVSPLTTVELRNRTFAPLVLFGAELALPPVRASLTMEDGECSATGDCGASN